MLSIGTAQFGSKYGILNNRGKVPYKEVEKILKHANKHGITSLDTAYNYGNIHKLLGNIGITEWNVTTKIPFFKNNNENYINEIDNLIEKIFRDLETDKISTILIHDIHKMSIDEINIYWEKLNFLKKNKYIEKIGYSIYDDYNLKNIYKYFKPDVIQGPLNLFNTKLIENGWLQKFFIDKVEFHCRSIFLQGLLLVNHSMIPRRLKKWEKLFKNYESWLKKHKISNLEACLNFIYSNKHVSRVVIGVQSSKHLDQIIKTKTINKNLNFNKNKNIDNDLIDPRLWE